MKLTLHRPGETETFRLLEKQQSLELTYRRVGDTKLWNPSSFVALPNSKVVDGDLLQFRRIRVGTGQLEFNLAVEALRHGVCFDLGWVGCHQRRPFEEGDPFAVIAHAVFLWATNICRIVYIRQREAGTAIVYSIGLGTLPCHAASGEEQLSVTWDRETDHVDFLIGSFSRPKSKFVRAFAWYLRHQQNRFATDAGERIKAEIAAGRTESISDADIASKNSVDVEGIDKMASVAMGN